MLKGALDTVGAMIMPCPRRQNDMMRGYDMIIGARLLCDLDALMDLPVMPYYACENVSAGNFDLDDTLSAQRL